MSVVDSKSISAVKSGISLREVKFVAFDVETTGLSPNVARLVELSGVKFSLNGSSPETHETSADNEIFSSLIDPEMQIPPEVTAIHGITQKMVKGAPTISTIIPQFLDWLGSDEIILVAHNAPFDLGFMKVALKSLGLKPPKNPVIDSLFLSRRLIYDAPNHQLKTLVQHLALKSGDYHRALADSHHVKNLLKHMSTLKRAPSTLEELFEFGCIFSFDGKKLLAPPRCVGINSARSNVGRNR